MQETKLADGKVLQEYFDGLRAEAEMDRRLVALKSKGHTLVRRIRVGRNDPCPCNSGLKFKKCHIGKVKLYD